MWPIGYKFEYKSNYGGEIIGIVSSLDQPTNYPNMTIYNYKKLKNKHLYNIYSTRGVRYSLDEIEIESLSGIRDRKLKELGI